MAPTRPECPLNVKIFLFLMQSQSWVSPEWVPTAKTFEEGLDEQLVTKSFSFSYTNLTTLEFPAFHMYTLLLNPTANKFVEDQSTKLR